MGDQRYVLPPPPRPWYQRISADRWFGILALLASTAAASFTGWNAWNTHRMRLNVQTAATRQAEDVRLARESAQRSADAAVLLAEGMMKSAEAGRDSATFAKQSVQAYRELARTQQEQVANVQRMFQLDQQPHIGFETKLIGEKNASTGKPILLQISVENYGKTPAEDAEIKTDTMFAEHLAEQLYSPESRYPGVLALGKAQIRIDVAPLPPSSVTSGKMRLYVYGVVRFRDAIGSTNRYSTGFCEFYPILNDGTIQEYLHGCSEGDPNKRISEHETRPR